MKNSKEFLSKRETATTDLTPRLKIFVEEYLNYKQLINKPINILDIGCGRVCLLFKYKKKEDKYYGCDFFKEIDVKIDNYTPIDLNEEKLSEKYKNQKFDVIFCGEVLEHLFGSDELLDEIKELMNSESILILSTPNLAYLPNRFLLLFGISPLFLENSSEFKLGRKYKLFGQLNETEGHTRVFTYGALKDLLKLKNFKIIKTIPTPSAWNIFLDKIICKLSKGLAPNNVFILKKQNKIMENSNIKNKEHWDFLNKSYSNNWKEAPKEVLSQREVGFINKYFVREVTHKILDIGVGNGRIMQNLVENSGDEAEIYGVDLSEKMVEVCKQRFEKEKKVKSIQVCDVSAEGVCFEQPFDFVSAVRVIKYNKNWVRMIENIYNKLNRNGLLVFSMLNSNSLSKFANYGIPVYLTTKKELKIVLKK